MNRWVRDITMFLVAAIVLTLSVLTYRNSVKPAVPAPVFHVVATEDPDLAIARMLLGEWSMEREKWTYVLENQAALFGMSMDELVKARREVRQLKDIRNGVTQ